MKISDILAIKDADDYGVMDSDTCEFCNKNKPSYVAVFERESRLNPEDNAFICYKCLMEVFNNDIDLIKEVKE